MLACCVFFGFAGLRVLCLGRVSACAHLFYSASLAPKNVSRTQRNAWIFVVLLCRPTGALSYLCIRRCVFWTLPHCFKPLIPKSSNTTSHSSLKPGPVPEKVFSSPTPFQNHSNQRHISFELLTPACTRPKCFRVFGCENFATLCQFGWNAVGPHTLIWDQRM